MIEDRRTQKVIIPKMRLARRPQKVILSKMSLARQPQKGILPKTRLARRAQKVILPKMRLGRRASLLLYILQHQKVLLPKMGFRGAKLSGGGKQLSTPRVGPEVIQIHIFDNFWTHSGGGTLLSTP